MPHHKRKRPKDRRAGCLMCKPHKSNTMKDSEKEQTMQERKAIEDERQQLEEVGTPQEIEDGSSPTD